MVSRRQFLQSSLATSMMVLPALPSAYDRTEKHNEAPILVVVELSGGNDGLNTLVPFSNPAYYQHRPTIGIKRQHLLSIDDQYGLNQGALGLKRLWDSGDLAFVHGCGYENPSYSHFNSMAYWQTASPNSGSEFGWVGRLADTMASPTPNSLINIGARQSLAVKSEYHTPVVFDDPSRFQREVVAGQTGIWQQLGRESDSIETTNDSQKFLNQVARSATHSSSQIRQAWTEYETPIDYGIAPLDLPKVAACIKAGLPTQLYYVSFRNNAFDTHVQQPALHQRLLSYACDAIHGFIRDVERTGAGQRVALMAFSEFGRRVGENANEGTDHGSANLMFVAGKPVAGGHYGKPPSLTALNPQDNLIHTTDFRQVYASLIDGWMKPGASKAVLNAQFETLPLFQS